MSLSAALNTAKSSLAASQLQTQITSSNIANVNTAGATRKIANVVTGPNGTVTVTSIAQSSNSTLFRNMLDATSKLTVATMQADAYARLNEVVGDTNAKQSPQAKVAALNDALSSLANTPGNYDLARAAAQAAQDLVTTIRDNADTVQSIRRDADNNLSIAASDMNRILKDLEAVNRRVVAGTTSGEDVTDQSDQRDRLVKELSQYVGVSVRTRGNNDMVIYTDSGVTLLENTARAVAFEKTASLVPGGEGNAFYIDGVAVTGSNSYMPAKGGMIVGLTDVRDKVANTYGAQLDELARGLISAFSEADQNDTSPAVGAKAGLFTSTQLATETLGPVGIGTFSGAPTPGTLSFTVTYEGVEYSVSGTVDATQLATSDDFAARLQEMIAEGKSSSGAVLGKGRVSVDGAGGTLTMSGSGVGQSVLSLSGLSATATTGLSIGASTLSGPNPNAGLASTLALADGVLANPTKVRDGVNGGEYNYNPTALGGFSGRINALANAMNSMRGFSATSGADPRATLSGYASSSISWLQDARSAASRSVTSISTLVSKTEETLSNETGINLDVELTRLIELERSYQASAKIISTVDQMLSQLLQSI
ncbi:flagellar hook-associated protein FlgK [Aureimonas sp. AU22]|uniref:flagellar hook-associated protein FlgK n=1 Tax=Aureimonas sp. AU22 TaxID=1638162 RepID=UPI0007862F9E|nr:flagellar hook-associated protein FlgK [Aureimonas sp. AU22]